MRPIDTIRKSIDTDLSKYHGTTLCMIRSDDDVKDIKGIGTVAIVTPLNKEDKQDPLTTAENVRFPVLIVNRDGKSIEANISEKYFVLALNIVQDKPSNSIGFLVSKSFVPGIIDSKDLRDEDGVSIISMQRDNITDGQTS